MSFPRGRGRIATIDGHATIIAWCPLCGQEHRYDKGPANSEDIVAIRKRGFSDEWLPCQLDLPGNYWRIVIGGGNKASRENGRKSKQQRAS